MENNFEKIENKKLFCYSCNKEVSVIAQDFNNIKSDSAEKFYCKKCQKLLKKQLLKEQKSNINCINQNEVSIDEENQNQNENINEEVVSRDDFDDVIDFCLVYAIAKNSSDLHLKSNAIPVIREFGELVEIPCEKVTSKEICLFVSKQIQKTSIDILNDINAIDFSIEYNNVRMRCNCFHDRNGLCLSIRLLTLVNTDFEKLNIPKILFDLSKKKSGLILITGPTGSGKTTTLTCLIDYINRTQKNHIIMLEEPIEFLHENKNCIISQREIGRDTISFSKAIVEALREDPDIIMIGEMRDKESIEAAIRAAETGHLVLSTLHTKGAGNSIDRIIEIFPAEQQNQIRTQLAMVLLGVVSQQLIPGVKPKTRYLATEVMVNTFPIQNLIRQARTNFITSTLQTSSIDGMYAMKSSLDKLFSEGKISKENRDCYQIQ